MTSLVKQLFKPTNRDLLKRIGFTILVLAIFIIGTTIQVPGTKSITKNLGFLELINSMGGGALQNFSIFALGVMPYITATILMQLLQEVLPSLQELSKQGYIGRQKINRISRYIGILFAFIEGYAFSFMFFIFFLIQYFMAHMRIGNCGNIGKTCLFQRVHAVFCTFFIPGARIFAAADHQNR